MEINKFAEKEHYSFEDLKELVALLRSPDGCPWDREQTHESIRNHFVEEAYEVCEGIDKKDDPLLCEELGDVLFQVLFHADIAREGNRFGMQEVIDGICKKMIRRHPHIFSSQTLSPDDIQTNWDQIKRKEKGEMSLKDTLSRVSTSLPALKRAEKFMEKGADSVVTEGISQNPMLQKGKAFYALVTECMESGIDPEEALNRYLNEIIKNCTNCE